jgi:hypothetical protein
LFYVLELPVPDEPILGDLDQYEYGSLTGIGVRKNVHCLTNCSLKMQKTKIFLFLKNLKYF